MKIALVFPNQLFEQHPAFESSIDQILLIEDSLFFGDWNYPARFHKQKLWLHRATMKRYQASLSQSYPVTYIDYDSQPQALEKQLKASLPKKTSEVVTLDPVDFMLKKRLIRAAENLDFELTLVEHPGFLNTNDENQDYREGKKRWFMADFYKHQRRRLDVLMDGDEPVGDQWSFDEENRKKVPKNKLDKIPVLPVLGRDKFDEEARDYVEENFAKNPGSLETLIYPTSHDAAKDWLEDFLKHRFADFGDYEDAVEEGESWLWHSILTPSMNIGLLTPNEVLDTALKYAEKKDIPLNSLEGFVRQIIGWREFMRATYVDLGVKMRTTNHWKHHRKMPESFYDGSTGILPIDDTIHRVLATGYCHHIERLMLLGGLMFLCEFDPDDVYTWFMEMFVDSYDWVMVTNAYAMSQNADGGMITTKPYFSGSSYVRKMSHYSKGDWCDVWDGLYWSWIDRRKSELSKNPRWAMMCSMAERMDSEKMTRHHENAEAFLEKLDQ